MIDITGKLRYVLIFTTGSSIPEVEEWLETHCEGGWSLELEGMTDDLANKNLKIKFSEESDKLKFKEDFVRGGPLSEDEEAATGELIDDGQAEIQGATYTGPERRSGIERRSPTNRRKPTGGGYLL